MKIFKFLALLFGAIAMLIGSGSCKKDEDKTECCSYSITEQGITYTYKACEDGKLYYSKTGEPTVTYSWTDDYGSWAEVKDEYIQMGASCS
jgi:uncharacterized lipoprotein YehR (DUF1307 family)